MQGCFHGSHLVPHWVGAFPVYAGVIPMHTMAFQRVVGRRLWKCACFVMVCHHCGFRYIEFFPNSMQESLFIGMLHAFSVMGVPRRVLTDNMKSVTL